jgi:hypothetical protein
MPLISLHVGIKMLFAMQTFYILQPDFEFKIEVMWDVILCYQCLKGV